MKTRLMIIGSALMASLLCLPAMAQTGPGTGCLLYTSDAADE